MSTFLKATIRSEASSLLTGMNMLSTFNINMPSIVTLFARLIAELLYGGKSADVGHALQHSDICTLRLHKFYQYGYPVHVQSSAHTSASIAIIMQQCMQHSSVMQKAHWWVIQTATGAACRTAA